MTKSTITREQLLEIIETDHVQCGEASYLARMALAAMDSDPVAWRQPFTGCCVSSIFIKTVHRLSIMDMSRSTPHLQSR